MFSEQDTKKGLRISILEGGFATVHVTVTNGAFLTGYALLVGANDFQVALIMSIPLIAQVMNIFSVHAIEHFGRRKWISGIFSVMGRSLWALLAVIPLIQSFSSHAIALTIIVFGTLSAMLSFSSTPWLSWMADLVPAKIRGRYFGKRNMILGIVTMGASIGAGKTLDYFKQMNSLEIGYFIVLMIAVVCGIIAFIFLTRQPEPPYRRMPSYNFMSYVLQPFYVSRFRRLLYFYIFFIFAMGIASSYFPVYLLKTLKWSFSNIALLSIGSAIMTLITQPLWGRIIDRVGNKPVITITVLGITPLPVIYLISTPQFSWFIWFDMFFTGIFWAGFNLVIFNMVIYSLPEQGRPAFLAIQAALIGMTNFIAMILGGFLAQQLSNFSINILGQTFINYHALFLLTLILRILSIPLINRLEEPEARTVGVVIRQFFLSINRHVNLGNAFWFLNGNSRKTLQ